MDRLKRFLTLSFISFSATCSVFSMSNQDKKFNILKQRSLEILEIIKKKDKKTIFDELFLYKHAPTIFNFITKNEEALKIAKGVLCSKNFAIKLEYDDFWTNNFHFVLSKINSLGYTLKDFLNFYYIAPYDRELLSIKERAASNGYLFFLKINTISGKKCLYCGAHVPDTNFFEIIELKMKFQILCKGLYMCASKCCCCFKKGATIELE
jgi:hypothetical protein